MGVRRAVNIALEAAKSPEAKVYTLGPLIHNSRVLGNLKNQGIGILAENEIEKIPPESTVIIRAHGTTVKLDKELKQRGVRILDATCFHVKENRKKAQDFAGKGYKIFLAGEKDHSEIIGIRSYVEASCPALDVPNCLVVANPEEAECSASALFHNIAKTKTASCFRCALIGQTTISNEEYNAIAEAIKKYFPNLEVVDTVCRATRDRQEALRKLCGQVNAIIIIGSRESANTRRLLALAKDYGKQGWLVETIQDIPPELRTFGTVGISAGASTPEDLITEIHKTLENY